MKTYARVYICTVVFCVVLLNICFAAEEKKAVNSQADREINQLLKENLTLKRDLFPNDKDYISDLKTNNKKLMDAIEKKKQVWEREINAGMNATKGNSDTLKVNLGIKGKYKRGKVKVNLSASGDYGESEGEKNLERLNGESQFNFSLGKKSFWFINGIVNHDDMANLDYRLIASPGIGYKILSSGKPNLDVEIGPAYVVQQYKDESADGNVAFRVVQKMNYKINDIVKLTQNFSIIPDVSNIDDFMIHAEIGIESVLTKMLNLRVTLKDDFINEPAVDTKKNDFYLISSLVVKF